jgi:beta-catenin-like protein 1
LFSELTDTDNEEELEFANVLLKEILANNGMELLTQNLTRLDESQATESQAIFNTLGIFENMIEIDEGMAQELIEKTTILEWLINRITKSENKYNGIRLYV